jgi:glycerate-2-kinase
VSRFDAAVLANDPERRNVLVELLDHALDAVDPYAAVVAALHRDGHLLRAAGDTIDLESVGRIHVLGLGKAAPQMAAAVVDVLADHGPSGVVVGAGDAGLPRGLDLVIGGHPLPDDSSLQAGNQLLDAAAAATEEDLVVVAVSGGGSALAEVPVTGATLGDIVDVTALMLREAIPIEQINAVRARLSAIKGGRLATAAGAARLVTLVLSDVSGNPIHVVASGPTLVPPQGTEIAADVLEMLPSSVRRTVDGYRAPPRHERHAWALVGDGMSAASAVVEAATARGINARLAAEPLVGEARRVGEHLATEASAPGLVAYAGETVVEVRGAGVGGRNQELALAAALTVDGDDDILIAALATDGIDGPTAAAGAMVDGRTGHRARSAGFDPLASLATNDSNPVLEATGDLLVTGPTGTNVADLVVVWRLSPR